MSIQFKIIMLECADEAPYPVEQETELTSAPCSLRFAYEQAQARLGEIMCERHAKELRDLLGTAE